LRDAWWIVVEKPEGKGPLGRYMHKLEDNIKMDNEEIEQEGVGWIYLVQDMVKL
jgi:predicted ATP-grasp superfamily ATP-dependent carboligase